LTAVSTSGSIHETLTERDRQHDPGVDDDALVI